MEGSKERGRAVGRIKSNVSVPRNRIASFEISLFKKYQRKEIKLIELIKYAFLSGLSTRKVEKFLRVYLATR
jgi:transposase-like protein